MTWADHCFVHSKLQTYEKTRVDSTEDDLVKTRESEWDCKATSLNQ